MARIEVAPEFARDLDPIVDHLTQHDASRIDDQVAGLIDAIEVLTHSPLMGRPVRRDLRELIVGRAAEGYVILYRYIPPGLDVYLPHISVSKMIGRQPYVRAGHNLQDL